MESLAEMGRSSTERSLLLEKFYGHQGPREERLRRENKSPRVRFELTSGLGCGGYLRSPAPFLDLFQGAESGMLRRRSGGAIVDVRGSGSPGTSRDKELGRPARRARRTGTCRKRRTPTSGRPEFVGAEDLDVGHAGGDESIAGVPEDVRRGPNASSLKIPAEGTQRRGFVAGSETSIPRTLQLGDRVSRPVVSTPCPGFLGGFPLGVNANAEAAVWRGHAPNTTTFSDQGTKIPKRIQRGRDARFSGGGSSVASTLWMESMAR